MIYEATLVWLGQVAKVCVAFLSYCVFKVMKAIGVRTINIHQPDSSLSPRKRNRERWLTWVEEEHGQDEGAPRGHGAQGEQPRAPHLGPGAGFRWWWRIELLLGDGTLFPATHAAHVLARGHVKFVSLPRPAIHNDFKSIQRSSNTVITLPHLCSHSSFSIQVLTMDLTLSR